MKYPAYIALAAMVSLLIPQVTDARIGESRNSFEGRLFRNGGIAFRDGGEQSSRRKSGPFTSYLQYLGSSAEVVVYFKSDDGLKPAQSDLESGALGSGWEVQVLYVSGKSVLELYKRTDSISEHEMNALLSILGAGAYWKKPEKPEIESEEEEPISAFGFDYVRSDEEVRAKKSGGGLMVFRKQLDEFLARQHERNLIQSAPQSVQGF